MSVPTPQIYKPDPITAKVRTGGAIVIWLAALALFALAIANWAEKGELEKNPLETIALSLMMPALLFWWAWRLWNSKEKPIPGHYEDIPDRRRYVDLGIVILLFAMPITLFIGLGFDSPGESRLMIWSIVGAFILSGFTVCFFVYRKKKVFIPDPPQPVVLSEAEIKARAEAKERWERIEKRWWYRYPLAGMMFLGAWFLVDTKPQLWWVATCAVIYGLVLAKELGFLALFGLACIVGLWIFQGIVQGISSLPVSLAVIIGALIIAVAVSR